ncbi:hypothetical protein LSUE1_G007791 [Lachnellula suecica]|uniref:CENP-V/GFA domain-containing protein n=1 Tax=Lachnellula suecica TaxID=602035 RepID=A0A8T9CF30_9HELO|nr:hypothetical protein LSUE1_G007791 [Lachnellula suecica]
MSTPRSLQGSCSCGRNRYTIQIPQESTESARVFFDSSAAHRRSQATPLSAWLRVPLTWYQSTTFAFFEDEKSSFINRTYTSPHDLSARRNFCGFCGTPLSYWSESPASEAEYISLTLGSLNGSDLRDLEDLGVLPSEALEDAENDKEKIENVVPFTGSNTLNGSANEGLPWFETMVEGSRLGKMKTTSGKRQSGRYKVEWEIVEWTDDGEGEVLSPTKSPTKRKLGEVEEGDSKMEGTQ